MSRKDLEELSMWEAKFRLYRTLNPEFMEHHKMFVNFQDMCGKCLYKPNVAGIGVTIMHCPCERLMTKDFRTLFLSEFDGDVGLWYCVEWIKHV